MSHTYAADRRGVRPSGLSPALQSKVDRIMRSAEKKARIESVRTALALWVDSLEREQAARRQRSVGDGAPSELWTAAVCAAADFETIVEELRK
jgi:hypothetical protein